MTANGTSAAKTPGRERYEKFANGTGVRKKSYCQYDYRHLDGELFSCVRPTLEACRAARDAWLDRKTGGQDNDA